MSTVSLIRATSYDLDTLRSSIEAVLEPLGGMAAIVKPGDRVLLKPNLLTGSRPTKECVTRKEIVYCVAKLVQEVGGQPFLGDSPAFGSAQGVAKANGYLPLAEELGLPIVEFSGKRFESVGEDFENFRLSKEAMDADVVINLPKVKSHLQLTMTLGIKNLFGCVPGKMKAWWHLEAGKDAKRFGTMLVETALTIAPELTLIDGIIGHSGNGPSAGEPQALGVLGASTDVIALDAALLAIVNVDPDLVPTAIAAKAMGLWPELDDLHFPLATPGTLAVSDWELPSVQMPIDFGAPRILRSTFKHFYIRYIKEFFAAYSNQAR